MDSVRVRDSVPGQLRSEDFCWKVKLAMTESGREYTLIFAESSQKQRHLLTTRMKNEGFLEAKNGSQPSKAVRTVQQIEIKDRAYYNPLTYIGHYVGDVPGSFCQALTVLV